MTLDELPTRYREQAFKQMLKIEKVPHAPTNPSQLSYSVIKHALGDESLDANQGEEKSLGRFDLRIERRSTKLLDKDNLYGGVKHTCDALRYAGLIREDDPESLELTVTQTKVKTRAEACTVITITPIP